jgi:ketosteroid isomerase-like protein
MTTEANKRLVQEYLEYCSDGNYEAAFPLLAESLEFWVAGHPDEFPGAGTMNKAQFMKLASAFGTRIPNGLKVTVRGMTAEGDRVAVEAESYGETASGKIYNNQYHYLFEVRDGQIQSVREYMDTLHANTVMRS